VVSWCHQDDGDAEDYGGRRPAGGARADHPHRRAGEHRPLTHASVGGLVDGAFVGASPAEAKRACTSSPSARSGEWPSTSLLTEIFNFRLRPCSVAVSSVDYTLFMPSNLTSTYQVLNCCTFLFIFDHLFCLKKFKSYHIFYL
jgi:hypothetical protein